ncbi:hypothetical protein SAMN05421780_10336 [Flexibacter flexilis DSM 6793]|uniref:YbbR-like protein n=1 Tax=Flexibacter flexilis DSM 6793 TaxID=927664 RepID=A0A1I1GPS9_9BACT|nr:hypothetical protein SAMN05421780_10336 [Flexibacter flexilis DSM 6793]
MNYAVIIARRIFKAFFLKKRDEWKVAVICVIVAATIWFLQAMNRKFTTRLRQPIQISYDSTKMKPLSSLPRYVEINATGVGWNLLRRNLRVADLQPIAVRVATPNAHYLLGTQLLPLIAEQVQDVKTDFVITDTLRLAFEPIITRAIPVVLDTAHLRIDSCFNIRKIQLSPAKVEVTGGRSAVNSLPSQIIVTMADSVREEDFIQNLPINCPDDLGVTIYPTQVKVEIILKKP